MSTPQKTKRISQIDQWGQERYDLGWADCRKREVEPLREENARLREALAAFLSDPNASKCTYVNLDFARAALAEGKGEGR